MTKSARNQKNYQLTTVANVKFGDVQTTTLFRQKKLTSTKTHIRTSICRFQVSSYMLRTCSLRLPRKATGTRMRYSFLRSHCDFSPKNECRTSVTKRRITFLNDSRVETRKELMNEFTMNKSVVDRSWIGGSCYRNFANCNIHVRLLVTPTFSHAATLSTLEKHCTPRLSTWIF